MPSRLDVVRAARGWLGVKWQHQGRTRHGIDCLGLIIVVADQIGIPYEGHTPKYPRQGDGRALMALLKTRLVQIRRDEIKPGDVLMFNAGPFPYHIGIATDGANGIGVIHARADRRAVVEHDLDGQWGNPPRFVAAFQIPELTDL